MNRIRRQKNNHHNINSKKSLSTSISSSLSFSWVPLTLILLLYTSGLTIGESTTEGPKTEGGEQSNNVTVKKNYTLTGNPQIDYVHDPNLPRELNGYNLSSYPFYSTVPSNINYSCDGLKDGFYANIEHKCQLYHHCIFGTRHDFLCANFTAFDQKTFICQFVSEVDCENSALFFHRNDALYKTPTTIPPPRERYYGNRERYQGAVKRLRPAVQQASQSDRESDSKPTNSKQPEADVGRDREREDELDESEEDYDDRPRRKDPRRRRCRKGRGRCRNRNRRPRPRRPVDYYEYDDYYEDDDYDDYNEYYDDRPKGRPRGKGKGRRGNKVASSQTIESLTSTEKSKTNDVSTSTTTTSRPSAEPLIESNSNNAPLDPIDPTVLAKTREEIFTKSRPPPRIRPPVPKYERNKYDAMHGRSTTAAESSSSPSRSTTPAPASSSKGGEYDEYYEDDYQSQSQQQAEVTSKPVSTTTTTTPPPTTTTPSPRTRLFNFRTPKSKSATTTVRPTPSTTTTTTEQTIIITSKAPSRSIPSKAPKVVSTTTTTTTTEAPQYEYEYEYEDELPPSSSTERAAPPSTTTTTTTTTEKPSRNSARGRRPSSSSSIQTSTSVTYPEQDSAPQGNPRDNGSDDASQNAINRRKSSWTRNQPVRTPLTAVITTTLSPNAIPSSTSEIFHTRQIQQEPVYQEPVITVKSAPPHPRLQASRSTEPPVTKQRPSRFWQRPSKVVVSSGTTTTEATPLDADYADYQDEPETIPTSRFSPRQKSGSSSTATYQNPLVSSGNSEESYNSQYAQNGNQYSSSNSNPQQYLRSTQTTYRQSQQPSVQSTTRGSVNNHNNNNYVSPYGVSPSSIGGGFSTSMRPEFISLLREDEDAYYDMPLQQTQLQNPHHQSSRSSSSSSSSSSNSNSRRLPPQQRPQYYGSQPPYHQSQKNLYSAAQETYSTFVAPPPRYSVNTAFMNLDDFNRNAPPMMFDLRNQNQPHHNMMFQM